MKKYEPVIGLEIHVQLSTRSKAYSSDPTEYGAMPNVQTNPVTLGHPGTLPMVNKRVIEFAVRLGVACNCKIRERNAYARKNYFYADLPKGYQITQDTTPICNGGYVEINDAEGNSKRINLTRIHMEEDSGKSIHDIDPFNTLVDLNRAGVPLLEIVSEPEFRNGQEVYNYLTEMRKLVRYLGISDGNMEEGSLRCDVNVSVRPEGQQEFGTKVEVKNMNSFRNVQRAIDYEIDRQSGILNNGGVVEQQTMTFDAAKGETRLLRSKEDAHDYRYFPEPDIQPILVTQNYIEEVRSAMPPLPGELFNKYRKLGLNEYDASLITEDKDTALYFEDLISHTGNYKGAANWIMGPVRSHLNSQALTISDFPITATKLAELMKLVEEGKVSHSAASGDLFREFLENPEAEPEALAREMNLIQESDTDALLDLVHQALEAYPEKVEEYKAGKKGLLGLFMGEVMKRSGGKADPKVASKLVQKELEK